MLSRRAFLRTSLNTSTLVALAPSVPGFLARTARAAPAAPDGRVLVVVQLDGGNDGLNTVVPYADEAYARHRRALRVPTDGLHTVTKEVGLHPDMGDAARLLEDGRLAIVQGVGYPNPERSHFKSMAIWHSADVNLPRGDTVDAESKAVYGWIGQALDEGRKPAAGAPAAQFVGRGPMPAALRSRRSAASAIARLEDSVLALPGAAPPPGTADEAGDDLAAFVRRSTLDAYSTSERVAPLLRAEDKGARYPASGLAGRLRLVARLIKGAGGTRVYYTSQGGYDTHFGQVETHARLLGELSGALKAFLDDLAAAKLAERVAVLCFSEFGRRVRENGSRGTDHGTAGPVFLAGPGVRPGLVGAPPSLTDLDENGDLKAGVDFRRVYAAVLADWLRLPSRSAQAGSLEALPLFRA
jgi:uncharacterized protein (DUF1501 family)